MLKRKILFLAFVVYSISAFLNNGFYYYDEHYQIVEFAELKSGINNPSDLAWEFHEKIRPTIQPTLAYVIFSILRTLGIKDPYILIAILRLMTAYFALAVISFFIKRSKHLLPSNLLIAYELVSYFLWFVPFLSMRFSSEAYSGLIFLIAAGMYYSKNKRKYLFIGCLLGLSFIFRFQSGLMSFGFVLWLIIVQKLDIYSFFKLLCGALLIFIFGFVIDCWYYKSPTITFINYFLANIVEQKILNYGVSPWHLYFSDSIKMMTFPIAIIIWLSTLESMFFNYRTFLPWIIVPFLLFHMLISHKEMRFLFPLVNLTPLLIMQTTKDLIKFMDRWSYQPVIKRFALALVTLCILINFVALAIVTFGPADGKGMMNITQTIRKNFINEKVILWTLETPNPYHPISPSQNFYLDTNVIVRDWNFKDELLAFPKLTTLIVVNSDEINDYEYLIPYRLEKVTSGVPTWIELTKKVLGYGTRSLSLYRLTGKRK